MKYFFLWSIIFACMCSGCTSKSSTTANRVYFTIDPNDRKIVIPVQLEDSIVAHLTFDTGWDPTGIIIDSAFVAAHPSLTPKAPPSYIFQHGSAWATNRERNLRYTIPKAAKVAGVELTYRSIDIFNWKKAIRTSSDGMFNIPIDDTMHVWEFNFEHNYLEVHPAEFFKMPKKCFLLPLDSIYFAVSLPLHLTCSGGDTITINDDILIDMGAPWDVMLQSAAKELDFFNRQEYAVWTSHAGWYYRYYTTSATMFDNFTVDSLRIYTFDRRNRIKSKYLIGLNFLKRFNVFFDMKNRQVGFQPISNFKRVVNPSHRRYHFATHTAPDGRIIVKDVGDYKSNYYKMAGLRKGDELVRLNGKPYKDVTKEEKQEHYKADTLVYDIVRKGQQLKLVVPVDKSEMQGD